MATTLSNITEQAKAGWNDFWKNLSNPETYKQLADEQRAREAAGGSTINVEAISKRAYLPAAVIGFMMGGKDENGQGRSRLGTAALYSIGTVVLSWGLEKLGATDKLQGMLDARAQKHKGQNTNTGNQPEVINPNTVNDGELVPGNQGDLEHINMEAAKNAAGGLNGTSPTNTEGPGGAAHHVTAPEIEEAEIIK